MEPPKRKCSYKDVVRRKVLQPDGSENMIRETVMKEGVFHAFFSEREGDEANVVAVVENPDGTIVTPLAVYVTFIEPLV